MQMIWPTQGHYCIATPHKFTDGREGVWWSHTVRDNVGDAVGYALRHGHEADQYFACLSLKEPFVIDEKKRAKAVENNWKNQSGKVYRVKENIGWARTFMMDLDVGKKYASRAVALQALKDFLKMTGLPWPWIVSSGGGLHIYWPLTEDVPADEWRPQAVKLKRICEHQEFYPDPVRTSDVSGVLRVPGTKHLKDPLNPKDVTVIKQGSPPTPFDVFVEVLDRATRLLPSGEPVEAPIPDSMRESTEPPKVGRMAKACAQIDWLIRNPAEQTEPGWYKLLGAVRFCQDGRNIAHVVSRGYAGYDPEETDKKLAQLEGTTADGRTIGPTTCGALAETCGITRCNACWFKKKTNEWEKSSPVVAARRLPLDDVEGVPPPPEPYTRTKEGVMKGGDEPIRICPNDFYPVRIIDDPANKVKCTQWEMILPRSGKKQFIVSTDELHDTRLLCKCLGNIGFNPHFEESKWLRHYMTAYLRELQRYVDEHQQHPHLGWNDSRDRFVMPHGEIENGVTRPTILTSQAETATRSVHRAGSLERQKQLLDFYNHPMYLRHQFLIGASLGSPLFYMTGHHGTVVNMSGPSGASKSTALETAGGLWGDPRTYVINGTDSGGTTKGKNNRAHILSNLPFCVDEVTLMTREEARSMIMGFTQGNAPVRLDQKANERKQIGTTKSSLALLTSNVSLHEMLAFQNQAGTAGSMRLFEIPTPRVEHEGIADHEAKRRADDYVHKMRQNYGWIGPLYMEEVTRDLDKTFAEIRAEQSRFDALTDTKQHERFWSAVSTVAMYSLRRAYGLGLLPFDPNPVEAWLVNQQMELMRTVVDDSYSSSVDTLLAFIAAHINNLIIIEVRNDRVVQIKDGFSGSLVGEMDPKAKQVTLLLSALKSYAARERVQLNGLMMDLESKKVAKRVKATPGAGTMFASGQHMCLEIDMAHPLISGHERMAEVSNVVALRRPA